MKMQSARALSRPLIRSIDLVDVVTGDDLLHWAKDLFAVQPHLWCPGLDQDRPMSLPFASVVAERVRHLVQRIADQSRKPFGKGSVAIRVRFGLVAPVP
ncbi:MAG: hypothetical protein C0524_17905 [Rhodobacter sp.]|nr:hypothetical protein [Rhodobacter sp.]